MHITFHGAAQTVTGSKHLITTEHGKRILLDCGLFQGLGLETEEFNRHFGFAPNEIDYLIVSHAHIDHSGLIPALVAQGFAGPIFCTKATMDLCAIMLTDSAHIQENDVVYLNKRRIKKDLAPLKPIYRLEDVNAAMKQFVPVPLRTTFTLDEHTDLYYTDAGHILGSAGISLTLREQKGTIRLFFSGDTGRYTDLILKSPEPFPQADYLITEATYGDRLHEGSGESANKLLDIVIDTCVNRKGKLIIPAFSLGRTQEIVYALDRLHTAGLMPHVPVYIDSPLATNATEIMSKHPEYFNPEVIEYMKKDSNPFGYDDVIYTQDVNESKALNDDDSPMIIISASGMMEAGRIRHHIANTIESPKNTVLIVGYVPEESLGGHLKEGRKEVTIFGKDLQVRARVEVLDSYSAHADYRELLRYLSCQNPAEVITTFIVHREPEAQLSFKEKLMDKGFKDVRIPMKGETFVLVPPDKNQAKG